MRKLSIFFCALFCAMSLSAAVTYSVEVPAGTKACYIAGKCTGWSHTEMTKVDDTHYTITLETTEQDGYKYCSGPGWAYVEKAADGSEMSDRTYAVNDVVAQWASVFDPGAEVSYVDITISVKADAAPTIWWWGAGEKCPNAESLTDAEGNKYTWDNQPVMTAVADKAGWYEWAFKDVDESLGVTFKLNKGDNEINAKQSTCYDVKGTVIDCNSTDPTDPTDPTDTTATYGIGSNLNEWTPSANPMTVADGVATCTIALGTDTLKFSVVENGTWLKNLETVITRETNTVVLAAIDSWDNSVLVPDVAGDYVFNFTIETKTLVVTYPAKETGMQTVNTTMDCEKIIRDGQVLIIREGKTFNLLGQSVQ